ncbi:UV DNA damage repair endonuclease UvsE [Brevibacillus antibioticus]|uniref:UV DNA damage repair endonuclease UvsE n=1 Tax=Brevibacillus antibioticus TaxID=2570228 RepID=A0A4U2Y9Z3_9BACL|nr:UV DNA damage repair endonuclease UvsE [Brevibacillus antibioticus]TKI56141.1 UV DNA damage repair endonuclease UvsE [Brevibacillus antibioticus]
MIRMGYACISVKTKNNPNKKTTVAQVNKLDPQARLKKLRQVMQVNFFNLMDLLAYNVENHIFLYRLPSEFVPLATHSVAAEWDWAKEFAWDFQKAGNYIRKHGIRLTAHPGHYSILNSDKPSVLESTIADFSYHAKVFDLLGLDDNSVLVTHVGGVYEDKASSLDRFASHFELLPENVKRRLVVENDDISFTMREVLELCERIGVPMVLDIHHHNCHSDGEDWTEYLPRIIQTWGERTPKMHMSSPKSANDIRAHADNIDPEAFLTFVSALADYNVDIILECKNKDDALLTLRRELKKKGVAVEAFTN